LTDERVKKASFWSFLVRGKKTKKESNPGAVERTGTEKKKKKKR